MNLYELTTEMRQLQAALEDNLGELTPELEEQLAINQNNFESKFDGYCKVIASLSADEEAISAEISRLQQRKSTVTLNIARLKRVLCDALTLYGERTAKDNSRYRTLLFNAWTTKTQSVETDNMFDITKCKYVEQVIDYRLNKAKAKEALQAGKKIKGLFLETKTNLTIK